MPKHAIKAAGLLQFYFLKFYINEIKNGVL